MSFDKEWFAPGPRVHPTMANPTPVAEPIECTECRVTPCYCDTVFEDGYPHAYYNDGKDKLKEFLYSPVAFESLPHERRVTDPETGGQKGQKNQQASLLPWDALMKVSEHYAAGAEKYEDRNWERGYAWHLTFDALQRHLAAWWQGEDLDDEGLEHLNAVVFHALALRTFTLRGIGTDDRPTNG